MKIRYMMLLGVGLLSGVMNVLLGVYRLPFITEIMPHLLFVLCVAGIPFGIITGLYFMYAVPVTEKYIRLFLWVIASTASYLLGVGAALQFAPAGGDWHTPKPAPVHYALGGLVGALILTIAFHFIFHKMSAIRHFAIVVAGSLIPFIIFSLPWGGIDTLYIVWQTGITIILGASYVKNEQAQKNSRNV